jgi:stage III sporulation protein AF
VRELVKTVTEWVRDLVVISLTFAFVEMLLPANDLRRFARVVMGIIMIAVIIGSVLDISSAIDDALESQAGFTFGETGTLDRLSWIAKGELITYAGLEVVEGEAERKIASQVESIARTMKHAERAMVVTCSVSNPAANSERIPHMTARMINCPSNAKLARTSAAITRSTPVTTLAGSNPPKTFPGDLMNPAISRPGKNSFILLSISSKKLSRVEVSKASNCALIISSCMPDEFSESRFRAGLAEHRVPQLGTTADKTKATRRIPGMTLYLATRITGFNLLPFSAFWQKSMSTRKSAENLMCLLL